MTFIQVANTAGAPKSFTFTATIPTHNGAFHNCTLTGSGDGEFITNASSSLTVGRAGYYAIFIAAGGYNNVGAKIFTEGVERAAAGTATPNAPDWLDGIGAYWKGFVNAGGAIAFQGRSQTATWGGNIQVTFIPAPNYTR